MCMWRLLVLLSILYSNNRITMATKKKYGDEDKKKSECNREREENCCLATTVTLRSLHEIFDDTNGRNVRIVNTNTGKRFMDHISMARIKVKL